jgi:hypothetical protein
MPTNNETQKHAPKANTKPPTSEPQPVKENATRAAPRPKNRVFAGTRCTSGQRLDPLRLEKYKTARLAGKKKSAALIAAGYTPISAKHHQNALPVAIRGEREIKEELRAKGLTTEHIIEKILLGAEKTEIAEKWIANKGFLELLTKIFFVERHHITTKSEDIAEIKDILAKQPANIHAFILSQIRTTAPATPL